MHFPVQLFLNPTCQNPTCQDKGRGIKIHCLAGTCGIQRYFTTVALSSSVV
jgi:hypothetical protein